MNRRKPKHAMPSLDDALCLWHRALDARNLLAPLGIETVPLHCAHKRILATPIWARISSPHYHAAAMDGYAVRAEKVSPGEQAADTDRSRWLRIGVDATPVDTGDPLPETMNAVIKIEETERIDSEWIKIAGEIATVTAWQHVRAVGEDIVSSQLILSSPHRIQPQDLGAIAGAGHAEVCVYRQPRVAILPTGTELVPPGTEKLKAGDIIEYNSLVLAAQVEETGAIAHTLPAIADEYATIKRVVSKALEKFDLVIVNAGSSAGSEDFTAAIVQELGELSVHGVAIRPGHPIVLGTAKGKALVGLPGYPVAAATTFDRIIRPLLYRWQGVRPPKRRDVTATLSAEIRSSSQVDHFARVVVGHVENRFVATPIGGGSSVIMSLVEADGIVTIPRGVAGYTIGKSVHVELLHPQEEIQKRVLCAGLDDPALAILAVQLQQATPKRRFSRIKTDQVQWLQAVQQGWVHMAAVTATEAEATKKAAGYTGLDLQYLAYAQREVGIMVRQGNPHKICGMEDLLRRTGLRFAARANDSTAERLWEDFFGDDDKSRSMQHHPTRIEKKELAVAAAVQSGLVDYGFGSRAVAVALDLEFIPLAVEQFYLAIPRKIYESDLLAPLVALVQQRNPQLLDAVAALTGYDVSTIGKRREENDG